MLNSKTLATGLTKKFSIIVQVTMYNVWR